MTEKLCPECVQGKHRNCTGWTLNSVDDVIDCGCACTEPATVAAVRASGTPAHPRTGGNDTRVVSTRERGAQPNKADYVARTLWDATTRPTVSQSPAGVSIAGLPTTATAPAGPPLTDRDR